MLLFIAVPCGVEAVAASDFPEWPVRNGDFSSSQGWGRPAEWNPRSGRGGKHAFKMEPIPVDVNNPPGVAVIETEEEGDGAYYLQSVPLLKGEYRLSAEVSGTPGAKARVKFEDIFSESVDVNDVWRTVTIELSNNGSGGNLVLVSDGAGTVKFRNVKMKITRLDSSPVPLREGKRIGAIVLPANPTAAEQYACYELQRLAREITGCVPGLKGRDNVDSGITVFIGGAADKALLSKLKERGNDSYAVGLDRDSIIMAGNSDMGTLYAVYDFLKQQGCQWVIPGSLGEVIPKRESFVCGNLRVEVPDYAIRGCMQNGEEYFYYSSPVWIAILADDYFDWLVRNRMNAIWFAGEKTYDLGAHRGHGWIQMTNHSYNSLIAPSEKYFQEHPEWYALVRGKRVAIGPIGLPSQLCVSNKELREYTVNLALDYFKKNPLLKVFPVNPMDSPNYWCECDNCQALDPPGLDIDWSQNGMFTPQPHKDKFPMTDRALNYANYVAERVSKVYPDRMIEMYAYVETWSAPILEKVHPNVLIKFPCGIGRPTNVSIMDPKDEMALTEQRYLDAWKKTGTKNLVYYNYADWEHPDATLFWFYHLTDLLKNLKKVYGFSGLLGQTPTRIQADPMWYQVMAQTLWNVDIDYRQVIRNVCNAFYGPAAEEMYALNIMMDEALLKSKFSPPRPVLNTHLEVDLATMERGRVLLESAAEKVKDDGILTHRIALARFAFAYRTYVRTLNEPHKNSQTAVIARRVFDTANELRRQYNIMVTQPTAEQLKVFYYFPPDEGDILLKLPIEWKFKTDSSDVGLKEEWYRQGADGSWVNIFTDKAWTEQGYDYHGVAWYRVRFQLPDKARGVPGLALYFGAVDGYADIYLDGIKIGEQKVDVGVMWDKPFSIALPENLDTSKPHEIVVRVKKDNSAAGIWKPVLIYGRNKRLIGN